MPENNQSNNNAVQLPGPNPPEKFSIEPQIVHYLDEYHSKSIYENLVNPTTANEFWRRSGNMKAINDILKDNDLFETTKFGALEKKVLELAELNKCYHNIDYVFSEGNQREDPYKDNYETLSKMGWRRHIFNILHAIRSDYRNFKYWVERYDTFLFVYDIHRKGDDPDDLMRDFFDLGILSN
jgi:hypothetical protein